MKLTVLTIALLTAVGSAAPAPEADPWCLRPGQSCWKAKREAEPWCLRPGQSCWKVKRAAEAFTEALQSSGELLARSPEAEISNLPGGAAFAAKRSLEELAQLIALTEGDPEAFYASLGFDDGEAGEDGGKVEKRQRPPTKWCLRPGQSCWKREAEADDNDKRWCLRPGQSCWKAKRVAEAVAEAVGEADVEILSVAKREAEADADDNAKRWCLRPGQSCWKAKRDLSAIGVVAREIIAALE
ncbi:clock-controlled pheromone ccg-4 precursor [Paramyrothecium foliicola]|nr:clock-controlled pheromone ccg-4 precursor [Paramyrothecium foliicola]